MKWIEEIVRVLQENDGEPMHYASIAEIIVEKNQDITITNATPNQTVNLYLNKYQDLFERVARGIYRLKDEINQSELDSREITEEEVEQEKREGNKKLIIKAYGLHWERNNVNWKKSSNLEILGAQSEAKNVNFATMRGVYILHYGQEIVYVGQAISDGGIGKRLRDHTRDRLANRWNKFSWFGLDRIDSNGEIIKSSGEDFQLSIQSIADVLEGMLLEILEPRSNRRGGNGFSGNDKNNDGDLELGEYSQVVDEFIEKEHFRSMVNKYLSTKQ